MQLWGVYSCSNGTKIVKIDEEMRELQLKITWPLFSGHEEVVVFVVLVVVLAY